MPPQRRPRRYLRSGDDHVRMQVPLLFSVYPAPRYAFRRGTSISIPDSSIAQPEPSLGFGKL